MWLLFINKSFASIIRFCWISRKKNLWNLLFSLFFKISENSDILDIQLQPQSHLYLKVLWLQIFLRSTKTNWLSQQSLCSYIVRGFPFDLLSLFLVPQNKLESLCFEFIIHSFLLTFIIEFGKSNRNLFNFQFIINCFLSKPGKYFFCLNIIIFLVFSCLIFLNYLKQDANIFMPFLLCYIKYYKEYKLVIINMSFNVLILRVGDYSS